MLNITKTNEDNKLNVAVEGRLDTTTAPELEAALKEDIANVIIIGTPEEVAGAVSCLASKDADFITGQNISVNGGMNI